MVGVLASARARRIARLGPGDHCSDTARPVRLLASCRCHWPFPGAGCVTRLAVGASFRARPERTSSRNLLALYNRFQTTSVIDATPGLLRSRMMGLVTVCIGTWPLGTVITGALSRPLGALGVLEASGGLRNLPRPNCRDSAAPLGNGPATT